MRKASALFADVEIRQRGGDGLGQGRASHGSEDCLEGGYAYEAQPIADLSGDEQAEGAEENLPEAYAVEGRPNGTKDGRQGQRDRERGERDGERSRYPDQKRSPTKNHHRASPLRSRCFV